MPTPSTEIVNGSKLRLSIGGVAVARATNCKFDIKNNTRKTVHKDQTAGFATADYGQFESTVSSEFLVCEVAGGASALLTSMVAKTKVAWIYGTGVSGDLKISGTSAVIESCSLDASAEENSTGSISLMIDGTVTIGTFT